MEGSQPSNIDMQDPVTVLSSMTIDCFVMQRARDEAEDIIKQNAGDVLRRWFWLYDRLYAWQQQG